MLPVMLTLETHPSDTDRQTIYDSIAQYNLAQVGDHWAGRLTIFARDRDQLLGGIIGFTDRGWLRIELLGVLDRWRRQGIGARLLEAAEIEACNRQCHSAWVDTFSFQALPFYQRRGYTIFGQLERYPNTHTRYFLQKPLGTRIHHDGSDHHDLRGRNTVRDDAIFHRLIVADDAPWNQEYEPEQRRQPRRVSDRKVAL